jgi:transposase
MSRKERITFTVEQKLDYAKLMVEEGYSNKQVMEISGAGDTAVSRWKRQYIAELAGKMPDGKKALTPEQQKIQSLEKQLWHAKRDNDILKKAAAFFARESSSLN